MCHSMELVGYVTMIQRSTKNVYLCFLDYKKSFDKVRIECLEYVGLDVDEID